MLGTVAKSTERSHPKIWPRRCQPSSPRHCSTIHVPRPSSRVPHVPRSMSHVPRPNLPDRRHHSHHFTHHQIRPPPTAHPDSDQFTAISNHPVHPSASRHHPPAPRSRQVEIGIPSSVAQLDQSYEGKKLELQDYREPEPNRADGGHCTG